MPAISRVERRLADQAMYSGFGAQVAVSIGTGELMAPMPATALELPASLFLNRLSPHIKYMVTAYWLNPEPGTPPD
jgi:hypothetical protein